MLPNSPASQALIEGEPFAHIADCAEIDHPVFRSAAELAGIRTVLFVPLRRDDAFLGLISAGRLEVRPFSEKQIALLQNFAAQAVIAMENARLITETRETLEQQTATAEVLQVINSSPGDLAPVFDAMVERAARLCEADEAAFRTFDGELLHVVAVHGSEPDVVTRLRQLGPTRAFGLYEPFARGERVVQFTDARNTDVFRDNAVVRERLELRGIRTWLAVALHKEGVLLGVINVHRHTVRPFSDKQIALLQNFAAQAVIAMENARLITETREALEQQTATAEVLQVINSSPGDLAPVFDAMLEKAHALCGAPLGSLVLVDGAQLRAVATRGYPQEYERMARQGFSPTSPFRRLLSGEPFVHAPDPATPAAPNDEDPMRRAAVEIAGIRTALFVPLRKDATVLGYISAQRQEVRPFTDKQIALLQNFAAQAVIAMENARLITETREALEQQTATAEVLQVINSSPGDLAPVFDAMLDKAMRLCGVDHAALELYDGERMHGVAVHGASDRFAETLREGYPATESPAARALLEGGRFVEITDAAQIDHIAFRTAAEIDGIRTVLFVPLRRDGALLGMFGSARFEVRPFSEKEIALVENFAAQAVIAMENARLITETREALEQQTATAEVLQVINSSPGDLAPVFDAMLEKATRLCGVPYGSLELYDGERFRAVAVHGLPKAFADTLHQGYPASDNPATRPLIEGSRFTHITDVAETDYSITQSAAELVSARTLLCVPLRRDNALLGMIACARQEVRPFSEKEIALLQNFAAQAVIAMENARLLGELRQRTRDLEESLEYQTATSDVLKVISRSTFDLEPVLEFVLETVMRLCDNDKGEIFRLDNGVYRLAVSRGLEPVYLEMESQVAIPPGTDTLVGRTALQRGPVHILDAWADPLYGPKDEARTGKHRTMLGVPLLREGAPIGVICTARSIVEPFTEKQIALVTTFADQAVIAIENARLFNELRQRTRDLQESLEYQTASSDVLKVISRSGAELGPVLDTLVETAARTCRAHSGFIFRLQDGLCRMVASFGIPAEYGDFQTRNPIVPGRGTLAGRTLLERRAVHIEDAATDPEYTRAEAVQLGRQRTMLGVPLIREDALIGVITLARSHVEPFNEKQIGLVTTFADQAVIAIENARLFGELRTRTEELGSSVAELKLLSEVGQAVSSTLDLRAVLSTILNASLGVTWANAGAIFRYIRAERAFRLVEAVGWDEPLLRSVRDLRVAETETAMGEAAARRTPIQLAELAERPSAPLRDASLAAGFHSALIVPLVGAERILGAIILMRQEAGEFPAETVRLMQTLASQSVLAIQNARLFREIADKSEQLALASQHKSQFLANMSHELRTPLNAILGYAELLVDGIYGVLPDRPKGVLERIQNNGKHLLALINDVLDLAKIEAGQLTLTLEDYSVPEVVKSVVTATEPLAASKGLKFTAALQDGLPMAHGDARRVSQVLLNLVGNAIKFTDKGEVEIRAIVDKGQFMLTVRDTGPGIADADQERIFGEFQQIDNSNTRKKGGTGLGLAISKRMVEMQGGTIMVESVLGQGSTFRVVLPVHVDEMMEAA